MKGTRAYAPVKSALDTWFYEASHAEWKNPAEVKASYANASIVGKDRVVFNIKGNDFRMVTAGSHADYDHIDVATVRYADKANPK